MMVQYVDIGGESRPVLYNYFAFYLWSKRTGASLGSLTNPVGLPYHLMIELMITGIEMGYRDTGKPRTITVEQMCKWLDESPRASAQIMQLFFEAVGRLDGDPEEQEDESQGKTIPAKM
jgi:hypothetical protein